MVERTCGECNGDGIAEYIDHMARPCDACHGEGVLLFTANEAGLLDTIANLEAKLAAAAPNQPLSDSVVERVAEAIWKAAPAKFAGCFRLWHEETPENKQVWSELARAAIAAIPSAGGLSETEERLARAEIKNACGPSSASEFPSSAGGVERKEDIQLIENIKWKSVDKDNMEYEARISCYQLDAINRLINKGT
jgi:hypothetical protein